MTSIMTVRVFEKQNSFKPFLKPRKQNLKTT